MKETMSGIEKGKIAINALKWLAIVSVTGVSLGALFLKYFHWHKQTGEHKHTPPKWCYIPPLYHFPLILSLLLICIAANKCLLPLRQNPTYNIMHKGETLFSEKQLSALRAQLWWVADRDRPFLMKFALLEETVLIRTHPIRQNWPIWNPCGPVASPLPLFYKTSNASHDPYNWSKDETCCFSSSPCSRHPIQRPPTSSQN